MTIGTGGGGAGGGVAVALGVLPVVAMDMLLSGEPTPGRSTTTAGGLAVPCTVSLTF